MHLTLEYLMGLSVNWLRLAFSLRKGFPTDEDSTGLWTSIGLLGSLLFNPPLYAKVRDPPRSPWSPHACDGRHLHSWGLFAGRFPVLPHPWANLSSWHHDLPAAQTGFKCLQFSQCLQGQTRLRAVPSPVKSKFYFVLGLWLFLNFSTEN